MAEKPLTSPIPVSMAPMEGITTWLYRQLASRTFVSPRRFYTPYLSPAKDVLFSVREWEELLPEHNAGLTVIPQLMVNRADLCLMAIRVLAELGYPEVNLNFGCPSGNLTRKKKGAGMLSDPEAMDRFLEEVFRSSPLPVSLKTRIGVHDPGEFQVLLPILRRYPFREMILHPRVRDRFYSGEIHMASFEAALSGSPFPVVYNGDIADTASLEMIRQRYGREAAFGGIMLGRGLIARPDLLSPLPEGDPVFREFYRRLEEGYREYLPTETAVLVKLKRVMTWRLHALPHTPGQRIALLGAPDLASFHEVLDPLMG